MSAARILPLGHARRAGAGCHEAAGGWSLLLLGLVSGKCLCLCHRDRKWHPDPTRFETTLSPAGHRYECHGPHTVCVEISSHGHLAAGADDASLRIFDTSSDQPLRLLSVQRTSRLRPRRSLAGDTTGPPWRGATNQRNRSSARQPLLKSIILKFNVSVFIRQSQPVLLWDLMPESVRESPKPRTLPGLVITASRSTDPRLFLWLQYLNQLPQSTPGTFQPNSSGLHPFWRPPFRTPQNN
eukprot:g1544.t1